MSAVMRLLLEAVGRKDSLFFIVLIAKEFHPKTIEIFGTYQNLIVEPLMDFLLEMETVCKTVA